MHHSRSIATLTAIMVLAVPCAAQAGATLLQCPTQTDGPYGRNITSRLSEIGNLDDGAVHFPSVSAVFPQGIQFAGTGLGGVYTQMWVNSNGNLTFTKANLTYTPDFIPFENDAPFPIIAPWYGDVDIRGSVSNGNRLWYCEDPVNRDIIVTWERVGYYNSRTDKLNSFQVKLHNPGRSCDTSTDFGLDIEYRYDQLQWIVGTASGGQTGGLCTLPFNPPWHGGTGNCYPAVAGLDIGNSLFAVRLPESGYPDVVNLVNLSNVGEPGVWRWRLVPTCGDGIVDPCEECDDGNTNNEDACTNTCTNNVCGDGYLDYESGTEICDGTNLGLLADNSCAAYDPVIFTGGFIRCSDSCGSYDFSNCVGSFRRCYADDDGDGVTGTEKVIPIEEPCSSHSSNGTPWQDTSGGDCADDPASVCSAVSMPGGTEVCDQCDNDCDGDTDSEDYDVTHGDPAATGANIYYRDNDGDKCGLEPALFCESTPPLGYVRVAGDQNDTDGVCCGNNVVEAGEQCDDGNTVNTDACPTTCKNATCGDGFTWQGHETCDDGNTIDTDTCPTTCSPAVCGDGFVLEGMEECDDSNDNDHDGCLSCKFARCGDGFIQDGVEQCDDGALNPGDGCSDTCKVEPGFECTGEPTSCTSVCGDGLVVGTEACDDNNTNTGDGCDDTCAVEDGYSCTGQPSVCSPTCGNGLVDYTDECDDGNATDGDGCSAACTVEHGYICTGPHSVCTFTCGDGMVAAKEACDDGGNVSGDGCSDACEVEPGYACSGEPSTCSLTCGNGQVDYTDECDDGNTDDGDGCSAACTIEHGYGCTGTQSVCTFTCGDGVVAAQEACDDGGTSPGDGCSDACEVEPGYACAGEPSVCAPTCGNGEVDDTDECDDNNNDDGDGCSAACTIEHGYGCEGQPSVCTSQCGDGLIAGDEACDDGGNMPGDGCSDECEVETDFTCTGEPSVCTPNPECVADADCGDVTSGRVCADGVCQDGCRATGGNGCPDGLICTSTDDTIGTCETGAAGAGGAGGQGGSAGEAGAAGSAGEAGSGQAGEAGAAGQAGEAGAAGAAGQGGQAGSGEAGAGGEAGSGEAGQGGSAGQAHGGSAGSHAGAGGEAGSNEVPGLPLTTAPSGDDGGCGCRVAGESSSRSWLALFGLIGAWLSRRQISRSRTRSE